MPWKAVSSMDQKNQFIKDVLKDDVAFANLCRAYEISRKTGYKWLSRYEEAGKQGLLDLSRAPKNSPQRVSKEIRKLLTDSRKLHPCWGPIKIISWLKQKNPKLLLPCASTVGEIFKSEGLIEESQVRIKHPRTAPPALTATSPNSIWSTDFKGELRMQNKKLCYPLTVADQKSRFILCCQGYENINYQSVMKAFERIFLEHGLPEIILSDNGTPFSSSSGLSKLSVWWIKLGIRPVRIQPGKPQQNGKHERMHRTLKQETARPPGKNMQEQQSRFDHFVREYNYEHPHEALGNKTPAKLYRSSELPMPKKLSEINYPGHYELRKVGENGEIKWFGEKTFISKALGNETVGLEEIDDGLHLVHFGPMQLGFINQRTKYFERTLKKY